MTESRKPIAEVKDALAIASPEELKRILESAEHAVARNGGTEVIQKVSPVGSISGHCCPRCSRHCGCGE
jgi:hypothetical protein